MYFFPNVPLNSLISVYFLFQPPISAPWNVIIRAVLPTVTNQLQCISGLRLSFFPFTVTVNASVPDGQVGFPWSLRTQAQALWICLPSSG